MKVLVTGADGLLGSNMVRLLLEAGHQVGVLIQRGRNPFTLEGLDIQRYQGDILDYPSIAAALRGKDAVIHAAASTAVWPSRSPLVCRVNIDGTENMIRAAGEAAVERFVYIGTANSFTPGSKDAPGDESGPYGCALYGLDYMDSKYRAQQLVLEAVAGKGLPALTVNPTFMIGPYDATPSSGTMLIRLAQGRIPGYTGGGKCWCHVKDVANAAVNALTMGRVGESYIAGNCNLDYGEFFRLASKIIGVEPPRRRLPGAVVLAGGAAGSLVSSFTDRQPLLSYPMARIACDGHYYNPEKARRELAMVATPLEEAVEESFSWLKDTGYLERV